MTSNYVTLQANIDKVNKNDSYKIELINARDRAELAAKNAKVSEGNAENSAQSSADSAEKATQASEAAAKSAEKAALEKQDAVKAKEAASESNLAAQEANRYAQKAAEQASQFLDNTQRCYEQTVVAANNAMTSQSSAQISAANALNSADIASKASNDAAKSNTAAEQAKLIAEDAKSKAETAQRAAEVAEANAYSYELKSLEAKAASENSAIEAKKYAEASAASSALAAEAAQGIAADREQIGANTAGLAAAQQDVTELKAENTALKAETARTARSLDYLWKKSKGIVYDTETVTGAGSSVTVPSGAMEYAALRMVGGMSRKGRNLLDITRYTPSSTPAKAITTAVAYEPYTDTLLDTPVDAVRVANAAGDNTNTYPIPQAIRDLCPDYGIGVSADCYNYIDFAAKQYHHRVGQVDLGTLNFGRQETTNGNWRYQCSFNAMERSTTNILTAKYPHVGDRTWYGITGIGTTANQIQICDMAYATADDFRTSLAGQTLCFELATPETVDLSAVWPDDFGILRVEAGGTINLHYPALDDGFELAVPSETEIMVDVAKVVGTDG